MSKQLRHGVFLAMLAATTAVSAQQTAPTAADTRDANLRAYIELLRSDVRAQKIAFITELMEFSEAEDKAFWPIYRAYDAGLWAINDERLSGIEEFTRSYGKLDDALADKLAIKSLELEGRRTALKQKYYDRFKTAMSATTAARFLQLENQLLSIVDLQIASSLPIVK
jgi:hypothetical protein